ncbi:unnamed protein product [Owenia fusiformis]|uniref:Hexosyltransferase n=1 Tax=Owenia fusiformis TaxID=6347 RepID=A0A8S4MZV4_OWEFU|nr:unnamed protein product [Owenia fusiformis]
MGLAIAQENNMGLMRRNCSMKRVFLILAGLLAIHIVVMTLFDIYRPPLTDFPDNEPGYGDCPACITRHPRKSNCKGCFPIAYPNILNNGKMCETGKSLDFMILIASEPEHVKHREAIRDSWVSKNAKYENVTFKYAFIMGLDHSNNTANANVLTEADTSNDIIQYNFVEHFRNDTIKGVLALNWAVQFCQNANILIKVDDDVFLNIPNLKDTLDKTPLDKTVAGHWLASRGPVRTEKSKAYVPYSYFPESSLPEYISSSMYLMTYETAVEVVKTVPDTPFFHLEGVYISFVIHKIGYGVKQLDGFNNFQVHPNPQYYCSCLTTSQELEPEDVTMIWDGMRLAGCTEQRVRCKTSYTPYIDVTWCRYWWWRHTIWLIAKWTFIITMCINIPLGGLLNYLGSRGVYLNALHKALYLGDTDGLVEHAKDGRSLRDIVSSNPPTLIKNV